MSRFVWMLILPVPLLTLAAETRDDDLAKLQGKWRETSKVWSGHTVSPSEHIITIAGSKMRDPHTVTTKGEFNVGTEEGKRTIDMIHEGPGPEKSTRYGLYEITNNVCTICYSLGEKRPDEISAEQGALEVWARIGDPPKYPFDLDGRWKTIRFVMARRDISAEDFSGRIVSFKGNRFEIKRDYESKFTITLNEKGDPKTIDLTRAPGTASAAGQVHKGIYKIEGDVLTVCETMLYPRGLERPTKFESLPGSHLSLRVLKREK